MGTFKDSKSMPKKYQSSFLRQRASTLGNVMYPIRSELKMFRLITISIRPLLLKE